MFDASKAKNMDNPSNYVDTNKLLWTSDNKSNVSNISGLSNFNSTIKGKIKYLYLNNNSFQNVNSLKEFTKINELQLMCNPNLYNIDGLENHSTLEYLTLHNCSLTSIGNYSKNTKKYSGGLTGCSSLKKITLQENLGLTSLIGIENAVILEYLIANNCDLKEINSLKNHSKISYLNLAENVNLVNVEYIQHCKELNYIFLDGNINMNTTELDNALNGKNVLISNCINGYKNIPTKYWDLFTETATVLDYSYGTLGKYLTVDSVEWVKIKGRTNVTKLKLDGQVQLTMEDSGSNYGINSTLSTMTGIVALSLNGMSQLNSISFVENMNELYEIDIRSVNNSLTDLSVLNGCTKLKRLFVNNNKIDFSKINTCLNRFSYDYSTNAQTWSPTDNWRNCGLIIEGEGNWIFKDTETTKLTKFVSASRYQYVSNGYKSFTIDLSQTSCTNLVTCFSSDLSNTIILPSTIKNIECYGMELSKIDYSAFTGDEIITFFKTDRLLSATCFNNVIGGFSGKEITKFEAVNIYNVDFTNVDFSKVKSIMIGSTDYLSNWNISSLGANNFSKTLKLYGKNNYKSTLSGLDNFKNNRSITELLINNKQLADISFLENMVQITSLDLQYNNISNISALSKLNKITSLNLSNNVINDLTPLVTAIGSDNKIKYTTLDVSNNSLDGSSLVDNVLVLLKLHKAGLQKVIITGNEFSKNEVLDLINGKTVLNEDGKQEIYGGFGKENVINE